VIVGSVFKNPFSRVRIPSEDNVVNPLSLGFMIRFAAIGVLLVGLSIPLIRRCVKRNRWYGFRTSRTLADDRIWYEANAYAGRLLLKLGIVFTVASIVLCFVLGANFVLYNATCGFVMLGGLAITLFLALRHLRSL